MLQNAKADKQGLAGVAALIVFIALVLVAAIAATVILDVTGELEQQASNTGDQAEGQLSSTLQVVETTGTLNGSDNGISEVNITVSVAPGADPVELNDTTIEMTTKDNSTTLTPINGAGEDLGGSSGGETGDFTIDPLVAEDDANNVIVSSQDRYRIVIDTTQEPALDGLALEENENVELILRAGQGGQAYEQFTVPSTLSSRSNTVTLE